jgi:hypothetical protein
LIPPPRNGSVLEASGVVARGNEYLVVFDNVRQIARIGAGLEPASGTHGWVGRWRVGEGYEDIAYSADRGRFYLLIEGEKHSDGTYKSVIEECDEAWHFKGRSSVDYSFRSRNRGFEGLTGVRWQGVDYLLAVSEGNKSRPGRKGRTPGGGRIHVLRQTGRLWETVALIKLPRDLDFEDYSALALRRQRLAVVSQKSSRLWIGTLRFRDWTIVGPGRTYELPRTAKGKRLYCTVEGLDWRSANTFVMVSDLRKKGYAERCGPTDQSIHIFRVP